MRPEAKFLYWPVVWAAALGLPYLLCPCMLSGAARVAVLVVGLLFLVWGFTLHFAGGRLLRLLGHSESSRSMWPDKLVRSGVYSCMRHPQHLGLAIVPIGIAMMTGSIASIIGSGWAVAAALLFLVGVEEPECLSKFGSEYCEYMRSTPAWSLSPSCLAYGVRYALQATRAAKEKRGEKKRA